jgi:serine/threonine protein kinase
VVGLSDEHNPAAERALALPFEVGTVLLGKYRVDRVIGHGGMGLVLAATHVQLQDQVAIKVLHAEVANKPRRVARFLREAQAAASLRSENVVRVFDVGQLDSGMPYMVMELLDGQDLANGPIGPALPIEDAVDYVLQACDAMAVAHARGMVHRDLKPANLILVRDEHDIPTIKVLDFGISKLQRPSQDDLALTEAKEVMGSPLYMSPEQVRSARDVDSRADIWSLGTILYELVTGQTPFNGDSLGAVLYAVTTEEPLPVTALRPDAPAGLSAAIARCLRKKPGDRYQTARELQQALLPFASARFQAKMALRATSKPPSVLPGVAAPVTSSVPVGMSSAAPPKPVGAGTDVAWADTAAGLGRASSSRASRWAIALVVAAVIAGAALWWRGPSLQAPPAQAPVGSETASPAQTGVSPLKPEIQVSPVAATAAAMAPPTPIGPAPVSAVPRRVQAVKAPVATAAATAASGGASGSKQAAPASVPASAPPVAPPRPQVGSETERPHSNPLDIHFK